MCPVTTSLLDKVRRLFRDFGPNKQMGQAIEDIDKPHFFLHRQFALDQDLLMIFNSKRCSRQCHFCQLPAKSSNKWISCKHIIAQFYYVMEEMKNSLSVLTRVTLSNEGSVLDESAFPGNALLEIAGAVNELRLVRRMVLETRLEFVDPLILKQLKRAVPRVVIDVLTGFETVDKQIRDIVLGKGESLEDFTLGLDAVAEAGAELTSYILYKPSPTMSDDEAYHEAWRTIDYLSCQCKKRNIPFSIRLNPMYMASGSKWSRLAHQTRNYRPPKLTDIMRLAQEMRKLGIGVYIGLSTENLEEHSGSYTAREDYTPTLIKPVALFNNRQINSFEGIL